MSRPEIEAEIATLTARRDALAAGIGWTLNARGRGVAVASGGAAIESVATLNQKIANLRRRL